MVGLEGIDAHFGEASGDVTDGGEDLEEAEALGAGAVGDGFCDEGNGEAEDATDADAGEEAEDGEVELGLAEVAEAGEGGIDQNREGEHSGAAEFVTEGAEDEAADAPADKEAGGDDFAEGLQFGAGGGELHELDEGGDAGEREEALVEAVEEPGGGGDDEDEPVVAGELFVPNGVVWKGGGGMTHGALG